MSHIFISDKWQRNMLSVKGAVFGKGSAIHGGYPVGSHGNPPEGGGHPSSQHRECAKQLQRTVFRQQNLHPAGLITNRHHNKHVRHQPCPSPSTTTTAVALYPGGHGHCSSQHEQSGPACCHHHFDIHRQRSLHVPGHGAVH